MKCIMKLYYEKEATAWEETLPLGNGSLGAMIWGGKRKEIIGLNEDSVWSGYPRNKNNQQAATYLDAARELIFEGSYDKAQNMIEEHMMGEFTESYLPLGNLVIDFENNEEVKDYKRILSLEEAKATVSYCYGDVTYKREYFISYPSKAFLIKLTCSKRMESTSIEFESQLKVGVNPRSDGIQILGQCPEHVDPNHVQSGENIIWGDRGIRFTSDLTILSTDGTWSVNRQGAKIIFTNASEIILAFTFSENEALDARKAISNANQTVIHPYKELIKNEYKILSYEGIRMKHVKDYRSLYSRVELYLGEQLELPTDERLERLKRGEKDESLYALYFQYGRYLLISSSRKGGHPANLQGIWNWQMCPPWSSNYTTNINLQMNYWPAQSCNLAECLEPYFEFLKLLSENGKETARLHYNCRGFSVAHNSDRWGVTNPVGVRYEGTAGEKDSGRYAYFPLGGAWLCMELWKYYEYKKDLEFLEKQAYPILKEAALFCLDWLVEYGEYYVTCPSSSPENAFYIPGGNGKAASMIFACTMDMTIIRELFIHFKKTCKELQIQDSLLQEVEAKEKKLYPYMIGRYGQLQEWPLDFKEPEPGHRHISHLFGLYPGELFEQDEDLLGACKVSLERRLLNGGGHTGWSCGWIANLFAVLEDSEKLYEYLNILLTRSTYPNLWDAHPPFQIDGNFSGIEAIANALVQDRSKGLKLLPALPKEWEIGYVKGLCIKNNKCVDIYWENGALTDYKIYNCK